MGSEEPAFLPHVGLLSEAGARRRFAAIQRERKFEAEMVTKQHGQIVETPTEARQAEPGPSIAAVLAVSTIASIFILAIIWFVFFRT
ncbi:hypothetical protein CRBSH125_31440 [Afipia carboxidovorans]|nr:hypothetical protein CRBSH125_31440 [Afipia carboxidovorans]